MVRKRLEKKSNLGVLVMAILVVVIVAFMLLYPSATTEKAPEQTAKTERPTPEQATKIKEGAIAPDFEVEMFNGEKVTLASLKGNVVLLNFWATWCPPCRAELKRVEKDIIERFDGRNFVFLPISRGESRDIVEAFRKENNYTFPMGLDPEEKIYSLYAETYIPRNFLIDSEGRVIKASVGYDEAEFEELLKLIETNLNK